MNTHHAFAGVMPCKRLSSLVAICCLALVLGACSPKKGDQAVPQQPVNPNEKSVAYGVSMVIPSSWKTTGTIEPATATKESLDSRRRNGERILVLEALGPASARGLESMIGVFVVSEEGTFMPREYAERLKPEEFAALSRDLLNREKTAAKKKKAQSGLLDVQVARESINGKLAICQRMMVAGPDGKPVRLINWDIYLDNGAGVAVKTVSDPESPTAETEINNAVKTMRFQ